MTSSIMIDKHVPIPALRSTHKYPYDAMEVGDSFFVGSASLGTMRASCRTYSDKLKRKFTPRQEGDGVRVWRVE